MTYEIFPSERDADLCSHWRGPVAGTFSATTDEGQRVATCTTLADVFTAITEREDSEMTNYMVCRDGVEIDTYPTMDRAAVEAELAFAETPDAVVTVVLVAEDPLQAAVDADNEYWERPENAGPPTDWLAVLKAAVDHDATQVGEWSTGGGCTCLGAEIAVSGMTLHVTITDGDANAPTGDDATVSLQVADTSDEGYNLGRWVSTDEVQPEQLQRLIELFALHVAHENPSEDHLDADAVKALLEA